jgi:hypothetical protein
MPGYAEVNPPLPHSLLGEAFNPRRALQLGTFEQLVPEGDRAEKVDG